jgi:hypothetical protein
VFGAVQRSIHVQRLTEAFGVGDGMNEPGENL